jgi:hypothetical protein
MAAFLKENSAGLMLESCVEGGKSQDEHVRFRFDEFLKGSEWLVRSCVSAQVLIERKLG